jgi:metal-responsive CopG/Arc/MetJ family transcriptional regulator
MAAWKKGKTRKGIGVKPHKGGRKAFPVRIKSDLIAQVDEYCQTHGINRSDFAESAIIEKLEKAHLTGHSHRPETAQAVEVNSNSIKAVSGE